MDFNEFKSLISEKIKNISPPLPEKALQRLKTELFHAEIYYKEVGDLYNDLLTKPVTKEACLIPFVLGITKKFDLNTPLEFIQTHPGASGGI